MKSLIISIIEEFSGAISFCNRTKFANFLKTLALHRDFQSEANFIMNDYFLNSKKEKSKLGSHKSQI